MKCKKLISKLNIFLIIVVISVLLVASLAYFTDRVTSEASMATMDRTSLDIVAEPDPTADPDDPTKDPNDYEDDTPDDPDDDLTNWWLYLNSIAKVNFNPGDKMDLSYILVNNGALAVDVRETFVIKSSEPLSATPEFRLFSSYSTNSAGANTGTAVVSQESRIVESGETKCYEYRYHVPAFTMSGNDSDETISGCPKKLNKHYYLVFDGAASNAFQGVTCSIEYVVEAKQHTDASSAADWTTAATATMTLGGKTTAVVPKS